LDCDVVVVQSMPQLEALVGSVTLSANLVLILGHAVEDVDPEVAFAAARSLGAVGYVIAEFSGERLTVFAQQLFRGESVDQALGECGPHTLVADPEALAIPPLRAFRHSLATIERTAASREPTRPPRPVTRGPVTRGGLRNSSLSTPDVGSSARWQLPVRVGRQDQLEEEEVREKAVRVDEDDVDDDSMTAYDAAKVAEELDRRRAGPAGISRFLQAALHREHSDGAPGERVEGGFLRNRPMVLLVGIGPLGPTRMVANVALDETQLGEPGLGGWDLEITLKPDNSRIERRPLRLPTTGSSDDVWFPVRVDPAADHWRARITVWHRARAIQSAILAGPVIDTDSDSSTGERPSLVIDGEFHPMAGLDSHTGGGATVELDTKPAVYCGSGDWLIEPREDEMCNVSNRIADKLGEMAVLLDEAADLNDREPRSLLEYLAVQGSLLLKALFPNREQREAVTKERFLQALRLGDAAPELPYEFVYDLDSPPRDFNLCTDWLGGIADGKCRRCHAEGADNRNILCPLGFWGLSKVIERHNAVGSGESRAQARLRRGDIAGKTPVLIKRAAIALSAKVDTAPRGAPGTYVPPSVRVKQALDAAGIPFDGPITDWQDWERVINGKQPDLLIILGHADFDHDRDEWSMQIGADSDLYLTRVFPEDVDNPPAIPGPVVFLFGCLTASHGAEQATFAREFQQRNASVVVGTTSTVLGRQAGPVTADLIAAVKAAAGRTSLGEMLRQARATGLAKGSVMAMALNAFGDADCRFSV
jgi:hypothetical protein